MPFLTKWQMRSALVVDDSAANRAVAIEILRELGLTNIREADNGAHALEQLEQAPVDLILTDLNMPGMDGIELLSSLAKLRNRDDYFVAVMSSVGQVVLDTVRNIAQASNLELLGVFPKPLSLDHIREAMDHCDPDAHQTGVWRSELQFTPDEVSAALEAGELVPYYQPKVLMADRRTWGMEALVRWIHPVHGIVPPAAFVEHLESGELGERFFLRFLEMVCAFMQTLSSELGALNCSVNLPVPLLTHEGIVEKMVDILAKYQVESNVIVVELTETSLMLHLAEALSALARLRMKGFCIAMDDYGTGYSSLKQLTRCPFNELKIDREFVHDAAKSEKKQAILVTAISLCQRLNLLSVAEGIETTADWNQLVSLGCEVAQGYLVSRPLPHECMRTWLQENARLYGVVS